LNSSTSSAGRATNEVSVKKFAPYKQVHNDPQERKIQESFKKIPDDREGDALIKPAPIASMIALKNRSLDAQLTGLFRRSTYVGLVDHFFLVIQYETKLILFRYKELW
jgi:hypothetical protein